MYIYVYIYINQIHTHIYICILVYVMMYLYITCIHMLHAHTHTQTPTHPRSLFPSQLGRFWYRTPARWSVQAWNDTGLPDISTTIYQMSYTPTEKPVASTKEPCIFQMYILHIQNECHAPRRARCICKKALQIQNESHNCTRAQCLHTVAMHMHARDLYICDTGPIDNHSQHFCKWTWWHRLVE